MMGSVCGGQWSIGSGRYNVGRDSDHDRGGCFCGETAWAAAVSVAPVAARKANSKMPATVRGRYMGPNGRKYWVPFTGSWRRRRRCCRSALRFTKSVSGVLITRRWEAAEFGKALLALHEEIHLGAQSRGGLFLVKVGEEGIVFAVVDAAGVQPLGKDLGQRAFAHAQRALDDDEAGRVRSPRGDGSALGGGRFGGRHDSGYCAFRLCRGRASSLAQQPADLPAT